MSRKSRVENRRTQNDQNFSAMGLGNYEACKYFRRFTRELTPEEHGNVFCVTHPDSEGQGSTNSTRLVHLDCDRDQL